MADDQKTQTSLNDAEVVIEEKEKTTQPPEGLAGTPFHKRSPD